jgi:hypothetical protein
MTRSTVFAVALTFATTVPAAADQAAGAKPAPTACSLLTEDVITPHSPASKESLKLMLAVPPIEDKIGSGTSCSFGGITMQVNPFAAANFDNVFGKYTPVPALGDKAYYHDNRGLFGELAVMAGGRMLTFQVGVPTGSTAAAIQPNAVALARAIIAKLK